MQASSAVATLPSVMHPVARTIPQGVWNEHYDEIKEYYMTQKIPLAQLMGHMRTSYGFAPTQTQWKKQLNKWEMKRNLSVADAAHILRLLNEPLKDGVFRIVRFRGQEKSRGDIKQYINRTRTVENELELLATVATSDPTPVYITYTDEAAQSAVFPQLWQPNGDLARMPLPEDGTISTWLNIPPTDVAPSEYASTQPSRPASHGSSVSAPGMDYSVLQRWDQSQGYLEANEEPPDEDESMAWDAEDEAINPETEASLRLADERSQLQISAMVQRIMYPNPQEAPNEQHSALYAIISATPATLEAAPASQWSELAGAPGYQPQFGSSFDSAQQAGSQSTQPSTPAFDFTWYCFRACIFAGKEVEAEVENLIESALRCFEQMILRETDEILTTLNLVLATLDAHGHCPLAQRILKKAHDMSAQYLGLNSPISVNIAYMLSTATRTSHLYSAAKLKSVLVEIENASGRGSRSALTATYHVGWALIHEHKCDEAFDLLSGLRARCELEFGSYHIQTFTATATLARVFFRLRKPGPAEELIANVIARVEVVFGRLHPYRLEALCRQAKFLEQLGRTEESERILREVLRLRYVILGPLNPRTEQSFKQLRDLLDKQEKYQEAQRIYEDILQTMSLT